MSEPEPNEPDYLDSSRMPLGEHLEELRSRVIKSLVVVGILFLVCFNWSGPLMELVLDPALQSLRALGADEYVIQTSVTEKFIAHAKIALLAAMVLGAPWILFQAWSFVGAGLYPHERRAALVYLPVALISFAAGVAFFYFIVMPWGLEFLLGFGSEKGVGPIRPALKISELLSFFITLSVIMGFAFELPLGMVMLSRLGIISPETYAERRKYAILIAFIAGAILTPPDVFTQFLLAVPLILLYEVGIATARMGRRGRTNLGMLVILVPSLAVLGLVVFGRVRLAGEKREHRTLQEIAELAPLAAPLADEGGAPLLRLGLKSRDSRARSRYLERLAAIEKDGALPELVAALADDSTLVRFSAARLLMRRRDPKGNAFLLSALVGPHVERAYLAGRILAVESGLKAPVYGAPIDSREEFARSLQNWWTSQRKKGIRDGRDR